MSVLLFGATGHLASTKIIPAAKQENMLVIPVSRKPLKNHISYYSQKFPGADIAYMSIDSSHVCNVLPRLQNSTKVCIEKPHGYDGNSFKNLVDSIQKYRRLDSVYFVDHFLHKHIPDLLEYGIEEKNIESIHIKLLETEGVEHRFSTFDSMGIIRDVVQNHLLMVIAELFAKSYNYDRQFVLDQIEELTDHQTNTSKYTEYAGVSPTQAICTTTMKLSTYRMGVCLEAQKKAAHNEYSIAIKTTDSFHKFQIYPVKESKRDAYCGVLHSVLANDTTLFPKVSEITRCWQIVSDII